ncbi:MAG: hypothetical protein WC489_02280 [Patescibacteria group bacterium]
MRLALLLPGFLDSPDYTHLTTFEKRLLELGYTVDRIDACNLWSTGNVNNYSITNYLKQVEERILSYSDKKPEEIILIGHSLGGLISIIAGSRNPLVTKIISLCSPVDISNLSKKWSGKALKHSERDLPNNFNEKRLFEIPYSFVEDGVQYSALTEIGKIHKPVMLLIAMGDTSVLPVETERLVLKANNAFVVKQPGIVHDFRFSQKDCNVVMEQIEKFLTK